MNSTEIDLLDFIKRLALSYKTIFFFILISIAIGYSTYDRNDVTVLDARIHDNNGIYDRESVDYIKHLLTKNSESLSKEKKYGGYNFSVYASSDNLSVTYTVTANTKNNDLMTSFAQKVIANTQKGYADFYKDKNSWVTDYDKNVQDNKIQEYNFTSISEYRNYIFWKEYTGDDVFLVEYTDLYHRSNSLLKRLLLAIGFGLFIGIAYSIVRIATKH